MEIWQTYLLNIWEVFEWKLKGLIVWRWTDIWMMSCCYQPLKHSECKRPIWRLAFICVSARGLAWSGLEFAVMLFSPLSVFCTYFRSLMLQDCFLVVSVVKRAIEKVCVLFICVVNSVIVFPEFPLQNHNSIYLSICVWIYHNSFRF